MDLLAKRIDRIARMVVARCLVARKDENGQWLDNEDVLEMIPKLVLKSGVAEAVLSGLRSAVEKVRSRLEHSSEVLKDSPVGMEAVGFLWDVFSETRDFAYGQPTAQVKIIKVISDNMIEAFGSVFHDTPLDYSDLEDFVQDVSVVIYRKIRPEVENYASTRMQDYMQEKLSIISHHTYEDGMEATFDPNQFLRYLGKAIKDVAIRAASALKSRYNREKPMGSMDDFIPVD